MKAIFKKLISILLVLCIAGGFAPATASAADSIVETEAELRSAVVSASDGDTITIDDDIQLTADLIIGKDITITSSNVHTINTGIYQIVIDNEADVAMHGSLVMEGPEEAVLVEGTLILAGSARITATSGCALIASSSGKVTVQGGRVESGNDYGLKVSMDTASAELAGGVIDSKYGVRVNGGTLNMRGGSINGQSSGIFLDGGFADIDSASAVTVQDAGKTIFIDHGTVNLHAGATMTSGVNGYNHTTSSWVPLLGAVPDYTSVSVDVDTATELTLSGVNSEHPFTVDGRTPAHLNASISDGNKATLIPATVGNFDLVLTASNESGLNAQNLSIFIPVEVEPTYPLTITAGTGGSMTTGSSGNYGAGRVINLNATASANYSFNQWISTGGGIIANANSASTTFTMPAGAAAVAASFTYDGGVVVVGGGGGRSTPAVTTPTYKADVTEDGTVKTNVPVTVNTNTGSAAVEVQQGTGFGNGGTTAITVPSIPGINQYSLGIPGSYLSVPDGNDMLTYNTAAGSMILPSDMLTGIAGSEGKKAVFSIGQGDKSNLSADVKAAIGDRPIIDLKVTLDGVQIQWNNADAPVTLSIPYEPTASELADREHIVIWYIDGSGRAVSVPNGRYDPITGKVTFSTTHFSRYAVAYEHKTFTDLSSVKWAKSSIEIMASKGIINGTGANTYSPTSSITRADYLVLLIKTLGLDAAFEGNFNDVKSDAYYYEAVGIAKKLGITSGNGNNRFGPRENISRQDMMVLTARALEKFKKLKTVDDTGVLNKFSDRKDIAGYAEGSLINLIENGLVTGSGEKINPRGLTTRAEAAVFLYRIYSTASKIAY